MSRSNARSRRLRRRASRTVPASVTAAILLAAGALAAVAAVARLVQGSWADQATGPARSVAVLTWGSTAVLVTGAVLVVLGLVLLVAGLKPGRLRTAALAAPAGEQPPQTDYVISTRALARLAATQADTVDGVDHVSASASGRSVHVTVTTTSEQGTLIRDRVRERVTAVLVDAGVQPAPRVRATVRTKGI